MSPYPLFFLLTKKTYADMTLSRCCSLNCNMEQQGLSLISCSKNLVPKTRDQVQCHRGTQVASMGHKIWMVKIGTGSVSFTSYFVLCQVGIQKLPRCPSSDNSLSKCHKGTSKLSDHFITTCFVPLITASVASATGSNSKT